MICEPFAMKTLAAGTLLPLDPKHASEYHRLPKYGHKDPLDRILVWQATRS